MHHDCSSASYKCSCRIWTYLTIQERTYNSFKRSKLFKRKAGFISLTFGPKINHNLTIFGGILVLSGIQCHEGNGQPSEMIENERRAILKSILTAPVSSLSTIQRINGQTKDHTDRERGISSGCPLNWVLLNCVNQQKRLH